MNRMPVIFQGQPLMPMKASRVRRFVKTGQARIRYDCKLGLHYLQLLVAPSGGETQEMTIGLDPGSTFDGFSVVSADTHHLNIELIQRPKQGKNSIKSFKNRQASNRRVRRSRLCHRPIRFSNRKSNKMAPTIRANVEYRQWLITGLCQYFPISRAVVEDVKFNHYEKDNGKSFSHVEIGKNALYAFIESLGISLVLIEGWQTKRLRVNSFGSDPKLQDKGAKSFEAHCVDSFVIACESDRMIDLSTGELLENEPFIVFDQNKINRKVTFIEKIVKQRRSLTRTRALYKDKWQYFRYAKGGEKVFFTNISNKDNVCRVKPPEEHSNHPKAWQYIDNGRAEKVKCNTAKYGGTVINGKQKFFNNNQWENRKLWKN